MGDTKVLAKEELARDQDALVAAKKVRRKAEIEASRPEVERTSLLMDIESAKDEVSSLKS